VQVEEVQASEQDPDGQVTLHLALVHETLPPSPTVKMHHAWSHVMVLPVPVAQLQMLCAAQTPLQESVQVPVQVLTSLQATEPPWPASHKQVAPSLQVHTAPEQSQCSPGQGDTMVEFPQPIAVRAAATSRARMPALTHHPGSVASQTLAAFWARRSACDLP
jgi:hypothetical protein